MTYNVFGGTLNLAQLNQLNVLLNKFKKRIQDKHARQLAKYNNTV